jgi:hypothetical protein
MPAVKRMTTAGCASLCCDAVSDVIPSPYKTLMLTCSCRISTSAVAVGR